MMAFALGLGLTMPRGSGLTGDAAVAALFANGEQGVWYDPSDLTTLFHDHLGTSYATYGQPVGLMLDKSGNGNHASQPTATARPTLGRMPKSGVRNILTHSDDLNNWPNGGNRSSHVGHFEGKKLWEVSDVDPTINQSTTQNPVLKANTTYVYSGLVRKGSHNVSMISVQGAGVASAVQVRVVWNEDGTVQTLGGNGDGGFIEHVGDGLYRFYKTVQSNTTGGNCTFYIWPANFVADGSTTGSVIVGGLQLEEGTTPTAFQKTGASALDVTEAGVESLSYLDFDGVDDRLMLATPLHRPNVDWMQGFRRSTLDTMAMLSNDNLSAYLWAMAQGTSTATDSNAGTPQYFANGKQVTVLTRRGLSDAIPLDTSRVLEARGADLANAAAWSEMGIGTTGWSEFKAHVYGVIMRDAMTEGERGAARQWLAGRSGATP